MCCALQQSEKGESEKDTSSQKGDLDLGFPDDDDESQGDGSKFSLLPLYAEVVSVVFL